MVFAREVNNSGYSLCIVNDKLLAMTDAKYGIILHEKEKSVLESFLASSFLSYEEPAMQVENRDKDYTGAASRIEGIQHIRCVYSPEQDSISLIDRNGEELVEFFEYVPLEMTDTRFKLYMNEPL